MDIIESYIEDYKKQYDFYNEIAKLVHRKLEDEIISQGIKAIVTYRAKRPDRLRTKLISRNKEKKYDSTEDIKNDIVDLAGVRASLYFPNERSLLDEIVKDVFDVVETKEFPSKTHKPKHDKRFSGYWANHYRISLKKDEDIPERYNNSIVEIQVASLMMHAWSEVEHDLVYKPLSGKLSPEELAILDEINGLVLTGEIALERLHHAMTKRTQDKKSIDNKYELTNFLVNNLSLASKNNLKMGKTDFINLNFFDHDKEQFKNFFKPIRIKKYINKVDNSSNESISDQILSMLLLDLYSDNDYKDQLKTLLQELETSKQKQTGFESFIRTWIILEKAVLQINKEMNVVDKKYLVPRFDKLKEISKLNNEEIQDLNHLRKVRNQLLHGIEQPSEKYLQNFTSKLRLILEKIINSIEDKKIKAEILAEIKEM